MTTSELSLEKAIIAVQVANAGGELTLTPQDFGNTPLGILTLYTGGNNDALASFERDNHAAPITSVLAMAIAVLTHKAGGRLITKESDVLRLPKERKLTYRFVGDSIIFFFKDKDE